MTRIPDLEGRVSLSYHFVSITYIRSEIMQLTLRVPSRIFDVHRKNPQCQGLRSRLERRLFSTEIIPKTVLARALRTESTIIVRSLYNRQGSEATPSSAGREQLLTTKDAHPH